MLKSLLEIYDTPERSALYLMMMMHAGGGGDVADDVVLQICSLQFPNKFINIKCIQ